MFISHITDELILINLFCLERQELRPLCLRNHTVEMTYGKWKYHISVCEKTGREVVSQAVLDYSLTN